MGTHIPSHSFASLAFQVHTSIDTTTLFTMTSSQPIEFVSLGIAIVDEIRIPNRAPLLDVVGGSGAFCTISICILSPLHTTDKLLKLPLAPACTLHPSRRAK
jgi:hypothetical protein